MENKVFALMYQMSRFNKACPFSLEKQDAYMRELFLYGKSVGVTYVHVGAKQFNFKTGVFKKGWILNEENNWELVKNIKPDAIANYSKSHKEYNHYLHTSKIANSTPMTNSSHFRRELGSKLSQYLLFKEFMAPSCMADNEKQLVKAAKKFEENKIVIKPLHGQQGFGVLVGNIDDLLKNNTIKYPLMVQKFIDSNHEIKGSKAKGFVDLRLTFIDHKLIYALSRVAQNGSCITNTSQGGEVTAVTLEQIQPEVLEIAKKFQEKLLDFDNCTYCIDFLFDNGKPIVVEMNTRPSTELLYKTENKPAIERNIIATTNQFFNVIQ